jgi:hypothetical protein
VSAQQLRDRTGVFGVLLIVTAGFAGCRTSIPVSVDKLDAGETGYHREFTLIHAGAYQTAKTLYETARELDVCDELGDTAARPVPEARLQAKNSSHLTRHMIASPA